MVGADCAELLDVVDEGLAEPGTVMVMDDSKRLVPCHMKYDPRVNRRGFGSEGISPGNHFG
jgi:hypothetical protein